MALDQFAQGKALAAAWKPNRVLKNLCEATNAL